MPRAAPRVRVHQLPPARSVLRGRGAPARHRVPGREAGHLAALAVLAHQPVSKWAGWSAGHGAAGAGSHVIATPGVFGLRAFRRRGPATSNIGMREWGSSQVGWGGGAARREWRLGGSPRHI